jgi:transposase
MSIPILGIDISKQKFDTPLLMDGKLKHKACKNNREGFETLYLWLKRQGAECVHVCLETTAGLMAMIWLHRCTMPVISSA